MPPVDESSVGQLDAVDQRILEVVLNDARVSNAEIASRVGIAASTAHTRLRSLIERGVIAGFVTVVDQQKLGRSLHALIGVTLRPGSREASIETFAAHIHKLPEVVQMFFVGGIDDFMVHIAVADSSSLRRFVVTHISGHQSVASTRTNVVFDYHRNSVAASFA